MKSGPPGGGWRLADDLVLADVRARVLGKSSLPIRLGKYRVERALGSGAMGRILLAHDESLDRRVALKLIAPQLADVPQARARIEREARAMARLSDPHVAQVYEVAEDGPQLFVAMEYVDGQDLRAWLDESPRPWKRVVEVFHQAGMGLAAAHDKGIVHRDFKPENVMLEDDGRARVVDFGLALEPTGSAPEPVTSALPDDARLTATGAWMGTPAYMAPEQWDGHGVDARSDQFSFCVALYEALASRRPYEGSTAMAIREAIRGGVVPPLAASLRVPRRVESALRRGLSAEPDERWPTMEPLLRALVPPSRAWIMGVVTVAALSSAAAMALSSGEVDACASADVPMDTVWSDETRATTEAAMTSIAAPWAEASGALVLGRLDAAAQGWRQAAHAVCSTEDAAPESSLCLQYAKDRLAQTIAGLGKGDAAVLVAAAAETELFPDARACLQPSSLEWLAGAAAEGSPPLSVEGWAQWSEAARSLGAMSTLEGAHDYVASLAAGRAAAQAAKVTAEASGDRPLAAHASWLIGRLAMRDGDTAVAEQSLREAVRTASQVHASPLRAAAMIDLIYLVGNDADRSEEAAALANDAAATLAALGDPPIWSARLATHRASMFAHDSPTRPAEAEAEHRRALQLLLETLGPTHPDVIVALGNLGSALSSSQPAEAEGYLQEALSRAEKVWGSEHPRTARLEGTLGLAISYQDRPEEAQHHLQRSVDIRVAALGADHDEVASARYNLAVVLRKQGEHAEAIELLRAGLAIREAHRGPNDAGHVAWLLPIGVSELTIGRLADARLTLQRALDVCELRGASTTRFATLRFALARAYAQDDPAKARVLAELARRAWDHEPPAQATIDAFIAELGEG